MTNIITVGHSKLWLSYVKTFLMLFCLNIYLICFYGPHTCTFVDLPNVALLVIIQHVSFSVTAQKSTFENLCTISCICYRQQGAISWGETIAKVTSSKNLLCPSQIWLINTFLLSEKSMYRSKIFHQSYVAYLFRIKFSSFFCISSFYESTQKVCNTVKLQ